MLTENGLSKMSETITELSSKHKIEIKNLSKGGDDNEDSDVDEVDMYDDEEFKMSVIPLFCTLPDCVMNVEKL